MISTYLKIALLVTIALLVYGFIAPAFISAASTIAVAIGFGFVVLTPAVLIWLGRKMFNKTETINTTFDKE